MDVLVSLIISLLLLVAGAGGSSSTNAKTAAEYWRSVLPETAIPQAILDQLTPHADDMSISSNNLKFSKGLRKIGPKYERVRSYGIEGGDNLKEVSVSYGAHQEKNLKEVSVSYETEQEGSLKEVSVSYGSDEIKYGHNEVLNQGEEDPNKVTMEYELENGNDPNRVTMSYGSEGEDDPNRATMSYGSEHEEDPHKVTLSYGSGHDSKTDGEGTHYNHAHAHNSRNKKRQQADVSVSYPTEQEGNIKEVSVSYGSDEIKYRHNEVLNQVEEDPNKVTMVYESEDGDDPNRVTMSYGSEHEDDPQKLTMSYGSEHEDDPQKLTMSYGSEHEDDPQKLTMSYGSGRDWKTVSTGHGTHTDGEGSHHHHHVHAHAQHSHNSRRQQADIFFFHDMLRPGSIITPTIPPTTSLPAFLPHDVADSMPFSTKHLSKIISMFAPASLAMARDIRWTLDTCEHPQTLPGQKAGCATSLESLAELPAALLGTRNVHAFSAANLPVEAPGTAALRGRYNVTAARRIAGDNSEEVVTCHDLTYPYAVYYCHTANPTAAYTVTLESMEDGAAPEKMEVLAVCHLDTSRWSPKNPFLELHSLKPGDVAVCHFLTKLSIIWVRAGELAQGDAHAMAL